MAARTPPTAAAAALVAVPGAAGLVRLEQRCVPAAENRDQGVKLRQRNISLLVTRFCASVNSKLAQHFPTGYLEAALSWEILRYPALS